MALPHCVSDGVVPSSTQLMVAATLPYSILLETGCVTTRLAKADEAERARAANADEKATMMDELVEVD